MTEEEWWQGVSRYEEENFLPTLMGQGNVSIARSIRYHKLVLLRNQIETIKEENPWLDDFNHNRLDEVLLRLCHKVSPKWWIDHQRDVFGAKLPLIIKDAENPEGMRSRLRLV